MEPVTIYWILFLIGFLFTLISALFAGFGTEAGGHDFDFSADHDFSFDGLDVDPSGADLDTTGGFHGHGEIAMSPISPITIGAFIGGAGGGAIISNILINNVIVNALSGAAVGFLVSFGVFYFVSKIANAIQGSSEAKVAELIGEYAEVITPIHGEQVGEIAYVFKGSRYNAPCRSIDGKDIEKNKPVKIWRVIGSTFYVKEVAPEETSFAPEGELTNEFD